MADGFNITDSVNEVLSLSGTENQARISELLTDISDSFKSLENQLTENTKTIDKLKKDNAELIEVNGRLFLKQGIPGNKGEVETTASSEPDIPDLKFEDLFNEKGELK